MGEPKYEKWKKQKAENSDDVETSCIYLPEEIVIDILTRIPVKSLLQFKTVCKKWNSLIRHPSFIHTHHERALTRPDGGSLIISACMHRQIHWELCLFNVPYEGGLAHQVTSGRLLNAYKASKSVNGLIALFPRVFGQPVYISNPSTRELVCLPLSNLRYEDPSVQLISRYSFGYDPAIRQYKVLNICLAFKFNHNKELQEKVATYLEIFTVGSNTWRKLDNVEPPHFRLGATSVCVNGAIHWRAFPPIRQRSSSTRNVIVAFDIGIEKFRVIPLSGRTAFLSQLIDVGGYLGLIGWRIGTMEEMWVLEEYENGVWTLRGIRIPSNLITSKVTPFTIGGIESGNYLVVSTDKKCLGVYYCENEGEGFRQFKVRGFPESKLLASFAGAMEVSNHVESLFSPRAAGLVLASVYCNLCLSLPIKLSCGQRVPVGAKNLLTDCHNLIQAFDQVWCSFAYREGNAVADYLAKQAAVVDDLDQCFDYPPPFLYPLLIQDANGLTVNRCVSLYQCVTMLVK